MCPEKNQQLLAKQLPQGGVEGGHYNLCRQRSVNLLRDRMVASADKKTQQNLNDQCPQLHKELLMCAHFNIEDPIPP